MRGKTNVWFLPNNEASATAAVSTKAKAMPNDELAAVSFKMTTGGFTRAIPGQAVLSWLKSIADGYATYNSTVTTYNAAKKEWDDGKRGAKPYQPKQPDAVPALLNQLTATTGDKASHTGGYGGITQYQIDYTALNPKAGHYFGTEAGLNTMAAAANDFDVAAKHNYHWVTNTGKTAGGAGDKACDPAYIQVTGYMVRPAAITTGAPVNV